MDWKSGAPYSLQTTSSLRACQPMKGATTQNHRAAQIWSVLVFAAGHQEIITYATVEKLTGLPKFAIGPALNRIANYCE
jgi:hypothetical protein